MRNKSAKRRRRNKKLSKNILKHHSPPALMVPIEMEASAIPNPQHNATDNMQPPASIWRGIYETLAIKQYEVQIKYWKLRAQHLEQENRKLRNQLEAQLPVYETSSEEEEYDEDNIEDQQKRYLEGDYDEEVDDAELLPEYLEFRAVTLKHREELRQQRERERLENIDSSGTV